jgi:PLP dependent protein
MSSISENILQLGKEIQAAAEATGRDSHSINVLAVSKKQNLDHIRMAYQAGMRRFAESQVQEALPKIAQLKELDIEWHFIGRIQSNKTGSIAKSFSWVHSLDRIKIAKRLSEQRPEDLPALNVCLQVNIDGDKNKAGVSVSDLPCLIDEIQSYPRLQFRGLMNIPRQSDDRRTTAKNFEKMQTLFLDLQSKAYRMDTLSMGMSADFDLAIAAGSTLLRIGQRIFVN